MATHHTTVLYHHITVPLYHHTTVICHCTTVASYHCTLPTIPLYSTTISICHCATVPYLHQLSIRLCPLYHQMMQAKNLSGSLCKQDIADIARYCKILQDIARYCKESFRESVQTSFLIWGNFYLHLHYYQVCLCKQDIAISIMWGWETIRFQTLGNENNSGNRLLQ